MATRDRSHKSQKRAKELTRQKKQEEKRQRRHNKRVIAQPDVEETDAKEKDEEREE